jgi:integrase
MARKYQGYFTNHILPELGAKKLSLLTRRNLLFHFNEFLPKKRNLKTGEVLLQGAARRNIFMALSGCLSYGVIEDYIPRNILKSISPPKKKPPEDDIETFSAHARDLIHILREEDGVDYCRWLFQFLGLRRAERLGLSWKNISGLDTENAVMTIRQQLARTEKKEGEAKREDGKAWYVKGYTKTESVRRIVIPEPFLSALREQKKRQDRYKKLKKIWNPKEAFADLVFLQEDGSIYTLNRDNEEWKKLLSSHGFPEWRGHLNRHITATWLAEQSPAVPMGTVRSILGHASVAMTYYYAKTTQAQQSEPLRRYGSALMKKVDE